MVTRKPLIVNASASQIQELPAGDSVDGIATLTATTFVGNGVVPVGGIIMWSGTIASLSSSAPNFKLCDGNNGTPDLRNRFIIGAHSDSGGQAKTTVLGTASISGGSKDAFLVSHTHGAGTYSAVANGSHTHTYDHNQSVTSLDNDEGNQTIYPNQTESTTDSAGSHTHTLSGSSGSAGSGTGSGANLPPYYALCYIMKA